MVLILMKPKFGRRSSRAAMWSKRTGLFSFVLLCVAVFAHRFVGLQTANLFQIVALAGAVALLAVILAAAGFSQLWRRGDRAGQWASAGVFFAVLTLAPIAWHAWKFTTLPELYDISTDLEDPPPFSQATLSTGRGDHTLDALPDETVKKQEAAYPAVLARRYNAPADVVMQAVMKVIGDRGWPVLSTSGTAGINDEVMIDTQVTSLIAGFRYAVIIRITDEDTSSFVDMRSASYYGPHDFGANAERIEAFLRDLDFAVATLAK